MFQSKYSKEDFPLHPLMVYYEVTQACDLVCKHCRACAQSHTHPDELSTELSKILIDQMATFSRRPTLVLTGGDPLKRSDIYDLIRYAVDRDLQVALTPSATPLANYEALATAKQAGVRMLGVSLDGADAETHDSFRGWSGSFDLTFTMLENASNLGYAIQINTTITPRNFHQIDQMAELLKSQGIVMWSVFFLIPVGRGIAEVRIKPQQYEEAFEKLWYHANTQPYAIKTTEAPHYRRFVLQKQAAISATDRKPKSEPITKKRYISLGVGDGKGIMFVGHTGEIYPAGFLPYRCGQFPKDSIVDVYQNHPAFLALRDPDQFEGKCGVCDYRHLCGGSRSRAYAVTGNLVAAEPDCIYQPS